MNRYLLLLIVALISLTASCNSLVTSPNATTTVPAPTLTETPKATDTVKPTVAPTLTSRPFTETPASTPQFDKTTIAIVQTVIATNQPKIRASYLSPDKKWRAEVIIYDCVQVGGSGTNAYEQLKLIEVSSGNEKIIDNQLQYCGGLGAYGLGGLFWSPNGRYFYYTTAREGAPDGCGYWERPIIRFDTVNQSLEYLTGGPLSPDKTKIATWQDREIVVWDLDQGEIARTSGVAPAAERGPIAWSPDSRALVYLQTTSSCPPLGKSYVVRLDLPELASTLLIESETPGFIDVIWDPADQVRLFDEQRREWRFDFVTKALEPVR